MQTIEDTWKHIRRSPYQSTAAVLTLFLTMLLVGLFALTSVGLSLVLKYFEGKPQITVFFMDNAATSEAQVLQNILMQTGKVSSITYVSKDEALAIYREQNKNDPLLLEMVTADILPASLEVSATDPTYLRELEPIIKSAQGVEEVVFQKDVVDALIGWARVIRVVGAALVGIFALNSLLVVMTIIGMKIALKKEEIEILTLVGASPWYIRMPFVLEGGFYGTAGAFVSWMLIMGIVFWVRPVIVGFLGIIPVFSVIFSSVTASPFLIFTVSLLFSLTLVGFLLGSIGSLIGLRRYLKF